MGNMASGKEVCNKENKNSQGKKRKDHHFLKGKISEDLREENRNIFNRVFVALKYKVILIKKSSLSVDKGRGVIVLLTLYK